MFKVYTNYNIYFSVIVYTCIPDLKQYSKHYTYKFNIHLILVF